MAETRSDAALLNPAERRVLTLLAQGHTAKSIADELGLSVHAVNERLRDARRKTGAGSSRELARRLASGNARINGDEIVEVAPAHGAGQLAAEPPRGAWLRLGVPLMILIALFATALLSSPQAFDPVDDPLVGRLLNKKAPNERDLHARVRVGPRDAAAEALMLSRYRALRDLGGATVLRAICGSELCEIAGTVPNGHALVDVQRLSLRGAGSAAFRPVTFKAGHADAHHLGFVTYLRRVDVGL